MPRITISSDELKSSDVPSADADWKEIVQFAHTLDGYLEAGSLDAASTIANKYLNASPKLLDALTLAELRISLFFEQRRWNHYGRKPEGDDLNYIRSLVEEIRSRVDR